MSVHAAAISAALRGCFVHLFLSPGRGARVKLSGALLNKTLKVRLKLSLITRRGALGAFVGKVKMLTRIDSGRGSIGALGPAPPGAPSELSLLYYRLSEKKIPLSYDEIVKSRYANLYILHYYPLIIIIMMYH
ncbi:hypothetical protein EVAR_68713_1 [Eumeta japonica]|uniref:Uncharacterized protein n=1 Tax=Eumeta variegata TaxID=151549 RepID=A0A4C1ZYE0_EUMVA|nr:hypothetical protein EVAR_68713_1 [Eumeta japonica]